FASASATAAAVTLGALRPLGAGLSLPALAMCLSRLVVGGHYPSDVAAGAVVGALVAGLGDVRGTGAYAGGARFPSVRGEWT
ncbi:phosphatase PAP2 family protein, partial [Streptomyces sp. SID5471]|nr:phosphatase PAP2 family protein [Streptomyces sp. SID5471]